MIYLKQSTASQEIPLGYFLDSTDGDTEETALTINNTDIKLWKNGATVLANKNSGGATHISNGIYYATLDATDTDTVGPMVIFVHVSGALTVRLECHVLEEAIYDALFGASAAGFDANQRVDVGSWLGTAVTLSATTAKPQVDVDSIDDDATAANNLEADYDGTGYNKSSSTILSVANLGAAGVNAVLDGIAVRRATAQAGAAGTITLDASASATDDLYNQQWIRLRANTGAGQTRLITDYNGTTKVATVTPNWITNPDATTEFLILPAGYIPGITGTKNTLDDLNDIDGTSVTVTSIGAGVIDANAIAANAIGASELATDAVNEIRDAILADSIAFNGADIAAILTDTAEIGVAGAGLTDLGGMSTGMKGEVNAEVDTALSDINLDHLVGTATGIPAIPAGTYLDQIMDDGTASFDRTTDSLQAIRDRGDAAWTTGAGTGLTALASGTAQAGTASTIQLAAGETFADDELNGNVVKITGGTGAGQARLITDYTGATDTATVTPNWITNPDATSTYEVVEGSMNVEQIERADATNQIRDAILDDATRFSGANIDATISSRSDFDETTDPVELLDSGGTAGTSAAELVDDVWDEAKAGHVSVGSFGEEVQAHALSSEISALNDLSAAEVNAEVDTALADANLDHLVGTAAPGNPPAGTYLDILADDGTASYDRTTDSLQAIRDRGDTAWITGGGGGITDILNITPLIPPSVDLANTSTWRLGFMLINSLDDLPSTAEITPGTIDIDRKAIGGTTWSSVVLGAACSELAGLIYYDEVFDAGTGYAEGDSIRITFKSQKITVAANDYDVSDANGRIFYTEIRQTMRGTDNASTFDAGSDTVMLAAATHTGAIIPTVTDVTNGVTVGTNNDKTGYSLSAAGVQAIWDALTSALVTVGSVGKLLVDNINATISSRSTFDPTTDEVDLGKIKGTGLTETNAGDLAQNISFFYDLEPTTTKTANDVGVAGAGLTQQNVRDAMKLSPTAGAPSSGSIDEHLDNISDTAIADAVHDEVVEGTLTLRQLLRLFTAALVGKSSGGGSSTITFRDNADSKARITATVDSNGNRTAVTLDET